MTITLKFLHLNNKKIIINMNISDLEKKNNEDEKFH